MPNLLLRRCDHIRLVLLAADGEVLHHGGEIVVGDGAVRAVEDGGRLLLADLEVVVLGPDSIKFFWLESLL